MKSLRTFAISSLVAFGVVSNAQAAPVQIDFNVAGFAGPLTGTVQTLPRPASISAQAVPWTLPLTPSTPRSWGHHASSTGMRTTATGSGSAMVSAFGVRRRYLFPADSYAQDEIEGDEILRLSFSTPVNLLGFNVTDMFRERELGPFGESLLTGYFIV